MEMRKRNILTIIVMAVLALTNAAEIALDGWNWLRGSAVVLAVIALVLNVIEAVRHG